MGVKKSSVIVLLLFLGLFTIVSLSLSLLLSPLLYSLSSSSQLQQLVLSSFTGSAPAIAFAQVSNSNSSVENNNNSASFSFRTYVNPPFGISLQYPASWQAIELKTSASKTPSGSLALLTDPLENASDTYHEGILVGMQDLGSKNTTLDQYTQRSINAYLNQSNNNSSKIHIIESTAAANLSGNPAHKILFTESFGGRQLKKMQLWSVVNNNKVYLAIFSAEESKYDRYLPEVLHTFNSFRIFKPIATITTATKLTNATTANLQQQNLPYEEFGISLQYPASWIKVQQILLPQAASLFANHRFTFFFVEFISKSSPSPPPSTINIGIYNLPSNNNIHLAQYGASIINFISKNGGKLIETGDTKVGGNPAQKIVYTLGNSAKIMYLWTIKGDKAYHFVYRSSILNYPTDLSAINAMLNSVQFKLNDSK